MYQFLDKFFIIFHSFIVVFNLFGWIWEKTRKANLIVLLLTTFSWLILGIWYGIGYCFCTDWHWQVRMKLGYRNMPDSYIKFLADTLTGFDFNENLVDTLTTVCFVLALAASIYTNVKDWGKNRGKMLHRNTERNGIN